MRGGRNKFGPLYRRDRQIKQQKVNPQANTAPYRDKMETLRPPALSDCRLLSSHTGSPLSSDAFPHMYPPEPLDCTVNTGRVPTPPPLTYSRLPHQAFHPQGAGEMSFSYSLPPAAFSVHPPPTSTQTPSCSATPLNQVSCSSLTPTSSFLSHLLEGEQDESQLCAKVLASLQREQANRGKHDCLNTFSIMCKMADQTLFGLVEWARSSALFKELKVNMSNTNHRTASVDKSPGFVSVVDAGPTFSFLIHTYQRWKTRWCCCRAAGANFWSSITSADR